MSLALDIGPTVAGRRVAALVVCGVHSIRGAHGVGVAGGKQPLAILVASGERVDAWDLSGGKITVDHLDRRYPGAARLAGSLLSGS
ncbi:hypothetical protein ACW9UR_08215 [Halovulum sp. GXIMD14794]